MNFNLKFKSNEALVADLKAMVAEERKLQTQILHYLLEVEKRKLYLPAYQYLFDFVTQELGYSEPAANRRIQAMRLMREIPQVEEKLESGKLSLSVVARVQGFIRREDKKRSEEHAAPISKLEKLELVEQMEGVSARECEKKLIAISPETALPREKTRPLTEDKTLIQFVADGDRFQTDEKKNLLGLLKGPNKFFSSQSSATTTSESNLSPKDQPPKERHSRNRHILQAIRDKVWVRDHGQCQYQDPISGRVCGSRHGIQFDHIQPYALGGKHTPENLQLLCGAHNRHRNFMGRFY